MKGAIIGDVVGSRFEGHRRKVDTKEFRLFTADSHFTDDTVLTVAATAAVTHHHPEGIEGAVAIALATFLARGGATKEENKARLASETSCNLELTLEQTETAFDRGASCQQSVPVAFISFLEARDFEETICKAIYVGGDSDTIACMAGALAEAYFGVPKSRSHPAQYGAARTHLDQVAPTP